MVIRPLVRPSLKIWEVAACLREWYPQVLVVGPSEPRGLGLDNDMGPPTQAAPAPEASLTNQRATMAPLPATSKDPRTRGTTTHTDLSGRDSPVPMDIDTSSDSATPVLPPAPLFKPEPTTSPAAETTPRFQPVASTSRVTLDDARAQVKPEASSPALARYRAVPATKAATPAVSFRSILPRAPAIFPFDIYEPYIEGEPEARNKLEDRIGTFLKIFFDRFDRNRGSLVDFYDDQAVFTYSTNAELSYRSAAKGWNEEEQAFQAKFIRAGRHLSRGQLIAAHPATSENAIVNAIRAFPTTNHDELPYQFEAWAMPELDCMNAHTRRAFEGMIQVTVFGDFQQGLPGEPSQLRSFTRSMILVPAPHPR
jgi:hypothetical protein